MHLCGQQRKAVAGGTADDRLPEWFGGAADGADLGARKGISKTWDFGLGATQSDCPPQVIVPELALTTLEFSEASWPSRSFLLTTFLRVLLSRP